VRLRRVTRISARDRISIYITETTVLIFHVWSPLEWIGAIRIARHDANPIIWIIRINVLPATGNVRWLFDPVIWNALWFWQPW